MKEMMTKDLAQIFGMQVATGKTKDMVINLLAKNVMEMTEGEKEQAKTLRQQPNSYLIAWQFTDADFATVNAPVAQRAVINKETGERASVGPIQSSNGQYHIADVNNTMLTRGDYVCITKQNLDSISGNLFILNRQELEAAYTASSNF